ncbi:hypothetical protein [Acinetobacter sp. CFCC 11171]|uniref:hypothetical protein n=1 Tax=Acinetobacter sp. CFCC 11171 TaxID=1775558 RepID=UPI000DD04E00|nr:hypothetical protein [Acinetobacter sp. CFCC 11171]
MKKVLGLGLLVLTLSACGGGGGDEYTNEGSGNGAVVNAEVMGIYTGSTNQGQSAIGLVDKNNKFWFLYSPPYKNGVTGFIAGNLKVSGNNVSSSNGKDFYFGGSSVYDTTLNGTVDTKKSLSGSIAYTPSNQATFDTVYDATMNKAVASLATISGSYSGDSAIVQGAENANLTISNTGVVLGRGQSGCTFTGKVTAEENTPYYNINLAFGYSPCYMAGQEVKGVVYYDAGAKTLYAVAENSSRQNAVLFLGTKQ